MALRILGPHPFERDDRGRLKSRIATVFPQGKTLVTLPGIHATQRTAYLETLAAERRDGGLEPLTREEQSDVWHSAVDLIVQDGLILIRPNPENTVIAFEADELLAELVSRRRIRFLEARLDSVHEAIKRRGECWRITPVPRTTQEMKEMIAAARIGIGGRDIYYFNYATGTRFLTCEQFADLGSLDDGALRQHLLEIQEYCGCQNSLGNPEVQFFATDDVFRASFLTHDFPNLDVPALRDVHQTLVQQFRERVPADLRRDDPEGIEWRRRMFTALIPQEEDVVFEEKYLGLSSEFHMHIEWLPGGRIENGELIFDPIFEETVLEHGDQPMPPARDEKARSLIFNYVRDYGDLEYINIGRIVESLSYRKGAFGRRAVYVVELKQQGKAEEIVKIVRLQKWDIWERLDEGKPLPQAMIESEEYMEYTLDRGLGCRRLGMNVGAPVSAGKVREVYRGHQTACHGTQLLTPYFERDYIRGMATDKIPASRFKNQAFALRFASLLGQAAAANMIVGRCTPTSDVLFDDGDEVLIEDEDQLPAELVVADYTGAFADYERDLAGFAAAYARPINTRVSHVADPAEFAANFLSGLLDRFAEIQLAYRERRNAFDTLFRQRRGDEPGSLGFRWARVLKRLDETDIGTLERALRRHLAADS